VSSYLFCLWLDNFNISYTEMRQLIDAGIGQLVGRSTACLLLIDTVTRSRNNDLPGCRRFHSRPLHCGLVDKKGICFVNIASQFRDVHFWVWSKGTHGEAGRA